MTDKPSAAGANLKRPQWGAGLREDITQQTPDLRARTEDARANDGGDRGGLIQAAQASTSKEEARLMRSLGMGLPGAGAAKSEASRVERHVMGSHGRAVGALEREAKARGPPANFDLNAWRHDVVKEINVARTRPADYAAQLASLRGAFRGKSFQHALSDNVPVATSEGVAALDDAIAFFKEQDGVPPLQLLHALNLGAQQGAEKPGTPTESRLAPFGEAKFGKVQEVTTHGYKPAKQAVLQWMLCDGEPLRKIRKALVAKIWAKVGVGHAPHAEHVRYTVLTLAVDFKPKAQFDKRHDIFPDGGKGDLGTLGDASCAACGKQIPGNYMALDGKPYHDECGKRVADAAAAAAPAPAATAGGGAGVCAKCGTKRAGKAQKFCGKCGNKH